MTASGEPAAAQVQDDFVPIAVAELELASGAAAPLPNALGQIVLLVRVHGVPLGSLPLLEPGAASLHEDLRRLALATFRDPLRKHLALDGLALPADGEDIPGPQACSSVHQQSAHKVSVIVCTIGEDPRVVQTVQSILDQNHENLELIVVDNRPGTGKVNELLAGVSDPRFRLVPQPRPGLSAARNAGLRAATGTLVAYTDDDAFADPDWVHRLARPFEEHPEVVCTTGLVLPAEIATRAQAWFEEFGAFDKGFERQVWAAVSRPDLATLGTPGEGGVLFPFSAGVYGSGNNMAFRRSWLLAQDLFDEALGAGTVARGGEDLDAFLTVMLAGGVLVYEPRAIVRHYARSDLVTLRKQMFGYGSGMAAVVVKHFVSNPRRAAQITARLPAGVRKLLDPGSEKNASKSATYPVELARSELAGYAAGPALYLRSRREARRRHRAYPGGGPGN